MCGGSDGRAGGEADRRFDGNLVAAQLVELAVIDSKAQLPRSQTAVWRSQ